MNEYIERDALRQAVLESQHNNPHPRGMAHIAHDCEHAHFVAMIDRFPVADVAPVVRGRWIYHDDGVITCSECGNAESSDSYYCRYCGAKMDGGADNA